MSNVSTYLSDALLNHSLGISSYSEPTTYLALYTTNPSMPAGTGGVEVSGGSYARVALSGLLASASGEAVSNTSAITFASPTANWGLILGVGVCDASSGGNILWAGPLTTGTTVNNGGTPFQIPIGDLTIGLL